MKQKHEILESIRVLAQAGYDKKGEDIAIMDMEVLTMLGDYFLVVTANNVKHAQSVADAIEDAGAEQSMTVLHREGYREGDWILLDFGDVICHVFTGESRHFYGLEELWKDAPRESFEGV